VAVTKGDDQMTKEMVMTPRLNPFAAAPAPMHAWLDFGKASSGTGWSAA
jgi:hypothetical protein